MAISVAEDEPLDVLGMEEDFAEVQWEASGSGFLVGSTGVQGIGFRIWGLGLKRFRV